MKLAARDIPRDRVVRVTPRGAVLLLRGQMLIWCSACQEASDDPADVEFGYCAHCCKFHRMAPRTAPAPPEAA